MMATVCAYAVAKTTTVRILAALLPPSWQATRSSDSLRTSPTNCPAAGQTASADSSNSPHSRPSRLIVVRFRDVVAMGFLLPSVG
jgi:hypothetical protein